MNKNTNMLSFIDKSTLKFFHVYHLSEKEKLKKLQLIFEFCAANVWNFVHSIYENIHKLYTCGMFVHIVLTLNKSRNIV